MTKEQLLHEFAEAYEKIIGTATSAAQRGLTRQADGWGPREIVAHLAGWEVMASVRIPRTVAGEFTDETQNMVMNDAINAAFVTLMGNNRLRPCVAYCAGSTSAMSRCSGSWTTGSFSQVTMCMNVRKPSLSIVKNTWRSLSTVTPDGWLMVIFLEG